MPRAAPPQGAGAPGYPTSNVALNKVAWMSSSLVSDTVAAYNGVNGASWSSAVNNMIQSSGDPGDSMSFITIDLGTSYMVAAVQVDNRRGALAHHHLLEESECRSRVPNPLPACLPPCLSPLS